jgi:hypothetical protein
VKDPRVGKIKAVYRHTYFSNQQLFYKTAAVLREFRRAGIDVMLLKGVALALWHYKEIGLRPMQDIDVLVPTAKAHEATELLSRLNWKPLFKALHSQNFQSSDGTELDLHWHVLFEFVDEDADHEFWNGAVPAELHGVQLLATNPTDLLLHVCVHGLKWNPTSQIRWVADAAMILKSANEIDWNRLVEQGRRHQLTLYLKEGLQYLKDLLNAPIPVEVLRSLDTSTLPMSERLDFASRTYSHDQKGPFLAAWGYYREYELWCKNHADGDMTQSFMHFLKHIWGTDRIGRVPLLIAKGLARRSLASLKKTTFMKR